MKKKQRHIKQINNFNKYSRDVIRMLRHGHVDSNGIAISRIIIGLTMAYYNENSSTNYFTNILNKIIDNNKNIKYIDEDHIKIVIDCPEYLINYEN